MLGCISLGNSAIETKGRKRKGLMFVEGDKQGEERGLINRLWIIRGRKKKPKGWRIVKMVVRKCRMG